MKNNKGSMGVLVAIGLSFVALIVVLGAVFGATLMGFYNRSVGQENGIKAQLEQNKNNYDNYFKKLKEAAQVSEMYAGDMQKLYAQVIQGRKGSDQELFRFIQEQNPQLDASIYKQLQQIIESGRNSFEADQKTLIDKKQVYETHLQTFPNNLMAGFFGFPKINLADYRILTSEDTESAFSTKKAEPINLRN